MNTDRQASSGQNQTISDGQDTPQQDTAQQSSVEQGNGRGRISVADLLNVSESNTQQRGGRANIKITDLLNPTRDYVQAESSNTEQEVNTQQQVNITQKDNAESEGKNVEPESSNTQMSTVQDFHDQEDYVLKAGRVNGPIRVDSSSNPNYSFMAGARTYQPLNREIARALDIQETLGLKKLNSSVFSTEQKLYLQRYLFYNHKPYYDVLVKNRNGDID
jgi:hypothetical protein